MHPRMCKIFRLLCFSFAFFLLPEMAYAAGLSCDGQGGVSGGSLFGFNANCNFNGANGNPMIFSTLVCDYLSVLDDIMSKLFCGMHAAFAGTLIGAVAIYVFGFGLLTTMGVVAMNGREVLFRTCKLAFVAAILGAGGTGVTFAFNFLIGTMQSGITWVLNSWANGQLGGSAPRDVFAFIDTRIFNVVMGQNSPNWEFMLSVVILVALLVPSIGALIFYFWWTTLVIFVRCTISYMMALSVVAFLLALAPLFLCFLLFHSTATFFDTWLKNMVSAVMQVIIMFAGLAVWLMMMNYLGGFFFQLADAVRPNQQNVMAGGVTRQVAESVLFCEPKFPPTWDASQLGPKLECGGGPDKMLADLLDNPDFIFIMFSNIIALSVAVYVFDAMMKNLPELARQLSGPSAASVIIGGGVPGPVGSYFENKGASGVGQMEQWGERTAQHLAAQKGAVQQMVDAARAKPAARPNVGAPNPNGIISGIGGP